jgi:hypothetical protein
MRAILLGEKLLIEPLGRQVADEKLDKPISTMKSKASNLLRRVKKHITQGPKCTLPQNIGLIA